MSLSAPDQLLPPFSPQHGLLFPRKAADTKRYRRVCSVQVLLARNANPPQRRLRPRQPIHHRLVEYIDRRRQDATRRIQKIKHSRQQPGRGVAERKRGRVRARRQRGLQVNIGGGPRRRRARSRVPDIGGGVPEGEAGHARGGQPRNAPLPPGRGADGEARLRERRRVRVHRGHGRGVPRRQVPRHGPPPARAVHHVRRVAQLAHQRVEGGGCGRGAEGPRVAGVREAEAWDARAHDVEAGW